MTTPEEIIAETLDKHERTGPPCHCVCGKRSEYRCECDTFEECGCGEVMRYGHHAAHVAAAVVAALRASGVALIQLPPPDDTGSGQDGEFDAWWGKWPDNNPRRAQRWAGHDVYAKDGQVWHGALPIGTAGHARNLARTLLAAAAAVETPAEGQG